ncbi:MAG: MarR family transcriptional regulator [Burkholderiales bacterium]|nr:MarR family transcriptional regulator [Burkholderiales bacterium]
MSETAPSEAVIRAWTGLVRAQARVLGAVEAELKRAGLPPLAWYDVLRELQRAPGGRLRPHEIERRLLLAQPNVSRLIDRLEHAGLVQRCPCPEDGRGQHVAITKAGRALRRRMWPVYRAAIQRHLGARLESARAAETLAALLASLAEPA